MKISLPGVETYFMEDPREKHRLRDKVKCDAWVERYLVPHMEGTESILDVGCGPGVLAASVARTYPSASITGLEQSLDRYTAASENLGQLGASRVVHGDATEMPLESNSFDWVYCRFMLEYLKSPASAISEMFRVCRPGGHVMLQDLDGQLLWHDGMDPDLSRDICTVVEYLRESGFDPMIGRKLYGLARAAGLIDLRVEAEPYHLYAGRIDDTQLKHWDLKLDIALPQMERALGSLSRARAVKEQFLAHLKREDTLTYSIVFTTIGTKPIWPPGFSP